ncbi:MAG: hypothetical protein IPH44_27490 [Myxococcales bacterium]|nr:hypothetical protein [Myxococcales bacterium]MBK7196258.1 hypothetical protein [Myxococcales bacterium]MBP6843211.1 hypothetical protein [Kofleriaceae bacterium]
MPLVRLLLVVLALVSASGLSEAIEVACGDACVGEPCDDGDCPPVCPGCACARLPVAVTTTPTPVAAAPPIDQRVLTFAPESEPSTPEPQEILRVPIARAS